MTFEQMVKKLLAVQPNAVDIRYIGTCHCQGKHGQLFYALPDFPAEETEVQGELYLSGGLYCVDCEFSNVGGVRFDEYEAATMATWDILEKVYGYPKK